MTVLTVKSHTHTHSRMQLRGDSHFVNSVGIGDLMHLLSEYKQNRQEICQCFHHHRSAHVAIATLICTHILTSGRVQLNIVHIIFYLCVEVEYVHDFSLLARSLYVQCE